MKTLGLKNAVLLVGKKIWSSVNLVCKKIFQVQKSTFKQIVLVLFQWFFKSIGVTPRQFVWKQFCGLRWGTPDSQFWHARYIQPVIVSEWFFLHLTQQARLYYFRKIYRMWFYCETAKNYGLKFSTKRDLFAYW